MTNTAQQQELAEFGQYVLEAFAPLIVEEPEALSLSDRITSTKGYLQGVIDSFGFGVDFVDDDELHYSSDPDALYDDYARAFGSYRPAPTVDVYEPCTDGYDWL